MLYLELVYEPTGGDPGRPTGPHKNVELIILFLGGFWLFFYAEKNEKK